MNMKHLLLNKADESNNGGSGTAPDFAKILNDGLKGLKDDLNKLNSRIDSQSRAAATPAKKAPVEEDGEELESLILIDPKKAVKKMTSQIREDIMSTVTSDNAALNEFNSRYAELCADYPEINDVKSDFHIRAKEIMTESTSKKFDASALERAVLRAASEKGVLPVKHRKANNDENDSEYLGAGSSGSSESRSSRRRGSSEKLSAATIAFAREVGLNVNDPKIVERLTKTHNDRKGNWNRYR
jgi:hypothetical protein